MSLVAGGGYAQYCIAQDAQAMAVPPSLTMAEAGAIPETLMTVWHNVFERGALKPGETLLVHGGSSGIGTMAIMLAKALGIEGDRHRRLEGQGRRLSEARRRSRHQLQDARTSSKP